MRLDNFHLGLRSSSDEERSASWVTFTTDFSLRGLAVSCYFLLCQLHQKLMRKYGAEGALDWMEMERGQRSFGATSAVIRPANCPFLVPRVKLI